MLFLCSENTLSKNSPSSLGSNVEGTIQYIPGGRLNLLLISLKLIKVGLLAVEALYLKKFVSNGLGNVSGLTS